MAEPEGKPELNVVRLFGGSAAVLVGEPDPTVVEALETVLADAKEGRVGAVCIVALDSDGKWFRTWRRGHGQGSFMVGALFRAAHELAADLYQQDT